MTCSHSIRFAPSVKSAYGIRTRSNVRVFRLELLLQMRYPWLMDFRIIAAAKPSIAYARDGVKFFEERLRPLGRVELRYVKAGTSEEVSARLLEAAKGCLMIAMDERGENWTTRRFERHVRDWQLHAVKHVAFLIGAADGHTEDLRRACDYVLCLGKHTMQHELALVVLLEQIYRVHTLLAGSPYHRD